MSEAIATPPAAPSSMGSSMPISSREIRASTLMGNSPAPAAKPAAPTAPATPPPVRTAQAVRPPVSGESGVPPVVDDGKKPSEKMFENLRNLAGKNDPKPAAAKTGEEGEEGELAAAAAAPEASAVPGEKKKVNPWKVIEEHKTARAKLEAEIAELKKSTTDLASLKAEKERLASIEKRNQELEETIKFVDFSKSKEFTEKYQKPYEDAWARAMGELKELTVQDAESGDERAMAPTDLLELVNLPLRQARARADELYGSSANEVMAYRKEIRALYEQQNQALENAKKEGVTRSHQTEQQQTEHFKALQEEVGKTWQEVNEAHLADEKVGKYFKPTEGNDEINKRLESGFKFVDETAKLNVWDPNLTAEQRKEAVARHAAVRSRAAAFGRLRYEIETVTKELAEAREKLAQYEGSTPTFGGDSREAIAARAGVNRLASLEERLRARAK